MKYKVFLYEFLLIFILTLRISCIPTPEQLLKSEAVKLSANRNAQFVHNVMRMAKAAEMLSIMDARVDPCEDFYKFACGNWAKINPADNTDNIRTCIFDSVTISFNRKIIAILNSTIDTNDTEIDKKVKNFYRSCTNFTAEGDNLKNKIKDILHEFGDMPALSGDSWNEDKFDWLTTVAQMTRTYNRGSIIKTFVTQDFQNVTLNRVYFDKPEMMLPSKSMYVDKENEQYRKNTKQTIISDLSILDLSADDAEHIAEELLNFEIALAEGLPHFGLIISDYSKLTSVEQLQQKYAPELDFKKLVNITYGEMVTTSVYEGSESYLLNLKQVITKTPKRIVANYIFYALLNEFAYGSSSTQAEREIECVDKVKYYFAKYLDNMIYRKIETQESEQRLNGMFEELRKTFRAQLQSDKLNWISEATRQNAIKKLNAMKFQINSYANENFLQEYASLVIDEYDFIENVRNIRKLLATQHIAKLHEPPVLDEDFVTLSFTPCNIISDNSVLMPIAFLQPYFFWDSYYPTATLFGNFGALIGHELLHGFDSLGRQYDEHGNKFNWWDAASTAEFEQRTKCFTKQYSKYIYGNLSLPETTSQYENIADNGGVRLAYATYLHWHAEALKSDKQLKLEVLPQMPYNSKQLFFLSFAQMWCNAVRSDMQAFEVSSDVHVPGNFRVIGALSNYPEFAKEFNCAIGTNMNPVNKCEIF